jgi:hypothetical protein
MTAAMAKINSNIRHPGTAIRLAANPRGGMPHLSQGSSVECAASTTTAGRDWRRWPLPSIARAVEACRRASNAVPGSNFGQAPSHNEFREGRLRPIPFLPNHVLVRPNDCEAKGLPLLDSPYS